VGLRATATEAWGAGPAVQGGAKADVLMEKLGPQVIEACAEYIRSDPETLRQVVGSVMRVKIPRKTSDDMAMGTICENSTLRRELPETRL